jgi:hypothetical protein
MKLTADVTFQQSHYADSDGKKKITAEVNAYDPTNYMSAGQIYAGNFEIECPFPTPLPSDFILAEVAALRKKQGELVAEGTKLEERIQSLLCIEAPKSEVL